MPAVLRPRTWALCALLAVAYWLSAQAGLALTLDGSTIAPFWPPTGVATAALLLWGPGLWPGVAVAAFAVELPLTDDARTSALIAVGNVAAPLVAAALLRRAGFGTDVSRLRDAAALVSVAGASMLVSATAGTTVLALQGLPRDQLGTVWATWWTGDTMGVLVVAPFLLCLHGQWRAPRPRPARVVEATVLLALVALASATGFRSPEGLRFLVFPVLATIAVRFSLAGAAPAVLIASVLATQAASDGVGLFADAGTTHTVTVLSLFTACSTFTAYLLAALTADRARAQEALTRQGGELELLVDARTTELSRALEQLEEAQHIAGMGSYDFDLATGEARWSDELYRLMMLPVGAPMSLEIYLGLCHPDEIDLVQTTIGHTVSTGEPFELDHRLRRADGVYRWMHCQGQVVRDEEGRVVGTRGTATDIDSRKAAERRFTRLVEHAPDAMVFVGAGGRITQVNVQTERLFGYAREELVGLPLEVLIPERFRGQHRRHRERYAHQPDARPMGRDFDLLARRRDGSEFPVEISLSPLETEEGTLVSASIRDVTDRKQHQDELAYRAQHDALTGLPNRLLLAERLQRAVRGLEPGTVVTVLFLDLDRLKWVNDSLGHDAGDTLICTVATRLCEAARPGDTVARFGGDEFVVLCTGLIDDAEALAVAERLRTAVSAPVVLAGGHTVVPTLSIGITTTRQRSDDGSALLRDADAAMYRAKEQGRDRTAFFAPDIHAEMRSRLATTGGLRDAIEHGQLRVHYQPIVSLATGAPVAVEALVRWEHPERGLLLPAEFLTLAEETGQVGALDREVVLTACREFGALRRPAVSLNVNVSLRHLSTGRLRETLEQGLAEGGLRPDQLTVEVTESADLSSDEFAALLAMVKGLGANVAIDDFGTGFSALSRLGGLAVDTIKVDRSFVTDVHTSSRGQALVAAMTQLAGALDAKVVAEGIELESQAVALRALGCVHGQGFLWSKGIPVDELQRWLATRALAVPAPRGRAVPVT